MEKKKEETSKILILTLEHNINSQRTFFIQVWIIFMHQDRFAKIMDMQDVEITSPQVLSFANVLNGITSIVLTKYFPSTTLKWTTIRTKNASKN